jgi:hypothetical protein
VAINQTAQEAEIPKTAIYALDQTTGVFRACEVDVDGILQTTAGSGGGGGGDVRIKDASAAQFASVDASGRLTVLVAGTPAVSVSNFPATQPVSGTVAVSNFPGTQPVSGTVSISGSVAVTGPLTDTQLRASAVPVSLASVPSHAVTITTDPVHVDGKGTAGAPSGGVVSIQGVGSGLAVPVSGTFWQATQPVSGPLTDTQLRASAVPMSLASLPSLAAGTNNIGDVDVLTLPAIPAGTNRIGSVRPVDSADADLTSAKWTALAGRYLGVHQASDLGRALVCFGFGATGGGFVSTASAETLLTMCWSKDGAALSSGTSYQVTASKRLRIMGVFLFERSTTGNTTATTAFLRLRINTGGAVLTSSPLQLTYVVLHPAGASSPSTTAPFSLSAQDGFELQAGWNFGIGIGSSAWTATTCVPVWDGCLVGFEY